MITVAQDYYELLYRIQDKNPPSVAVLLPKDEKIYKIDLEKRTIESPEYLSVELDHRAETIYFEVDRYFDGFDLANTCCVIQYINAEGKGRIYPVPFYDISTVQDKILFPWSIGGDATAAAGEVQYAIRFFKIDEEGKYFTYNLNTLKTSSKVLHGMSSNIFEDEEYLFPTDTIEQIYASINTIKTAQDLYWIDNF